MASANTILITGGNRDLPRGEVSSLVVVKFDGSSETDALEAVKELESSHSVASLDIVVVNAGISQCLRLVSEVRGSDMLEHFKVNVLGVIYLFQAVLPLLSKGKCPKFVPISSGAGSLGFMEQVHFPNAAYGGSKAILNYITCKIQFDRLSDQSWTDMGNRGAALLEFEKAFITVAESVEGMVKVIDAATRDKTSGQFMSYDGTVVAW